MPRLVTSSRVKQSNDHLSHGFIAPKVLRNVRIAGGFYTNSWFITFIRRDVRKRVSYVFKTPSRASLRVKRKVEEFQGQRIQLPAILLLYKSPPLHLSFARSSSLFLRKLQTVRMLFAGALWRALGECRRLRELLVTSMVVYRMIFYSLVVNWAISSAG